ncbi:MAG: VIT1/CCC1 family protein [Actinomycetaceae bacterium]|nr:VIT1/CCC1 family protein [Actinomycetaceae bacterium]
MVEEQFLTPSKATIRKWRQYLGEERLEADTYRMLARQKTGRERDILLQLSKAEERHEAHWLNLLGDHALPAPKAPLLSRLMSTCARIFGSIFVLALMQRSEERTEYDTDTDALPQMAADEHIHGEVVRALAAKHRCAMSGSFRAAVFGASDGLVSTAALILGVMGAGVGKESIVAAGIAGLLAGALSMGAGEYISVQSQRELLEASGSDPKAQSSLGNLDIQENELELVFQARGDDTETARSRAKALILDSQAGGSTPLDEVSTEFEEVGSGKKAAISSFVFFSCGAFIPLFPFLFPLNVSVAGITALILSGVALFVIGAIVGLLSGVHPVPKALRQLSIGYGAAACTYLLGMLFQTTIISIQ